jgi:hypothetical protein
MSVRSLTTSPLAGDETFALVELKTRNTVVCTIYVRLSGQHAYHIFERLPFRSSGPAQDWARSFDPDIKIVRVAHFEWE